MPPNKRSLGWFKPYTVVQKVWKFIVSAAYPICLIRLELHTKNFENPCMLKGGNSGGPFLLLWLLIEALRKKSFCLKILLAILQLMWILDIFIHKGPNFQKNTFGSILYPHRVLHMRFKYILCLSRLNNALLQESFCLKILLAMPHFIWILDIIIQKGPNFQKSMFGSILYPYRVLHMVLKYILCLSRLNNALLQTSFCLKILLAMPHLIWILDIIMQKGPNFQKNMLGSTLYPHRALQIHFVTNTTK